MAERERNRLCDYCDFYQYDNWIIYHINICDIELKATSFKYIINSSVKLYLVIVNETHLKF